MFYMTLHGGTEWYGSNVLNTKDIGMFFLVFFLFRKRFVAPLFCWQCRLFYNRRMNLGHCFGLFSRGCQLPPNYHCSQLLCEDVLHTFNGHALFLIGKAPWVLKSFSLGSVGVAVALRTTGTKMPCGWFPVNIKKQKSLDVNVCGVGEKPEAGNWRVAF